MVFRRDISEKWRCVPLIHRVMAHLSSLMWRGRGETPLFGPNRYVHGNREWFPGCLFGTEAFQRVPRLGQIFVLNRFRPGLKAGGTRLPKFPSRSPPPPSPPTPPILRVSCIEFTCSQRITFSSRGFSCLIPRKIEKNNNDTVYVRKFIVHVAWQQVKLACTNENVASFRHILIGKPLHSRYALTRSSVHGGSPGIINPSLWI